MLLTFRFYWIFFFSEMRYRVNVPKANVQQENVPKANAPAQNKQKKKKCSIYSFLSTNFNENLNNRYHSIPYLQLYHILAVQLNRY